MSVTDMYNCTHGPKRDCHACLIPEMAAVLEQAVGYFAGGDHVTFWRDWLLKARALIEKAKLIDDCIPSEEAYEAAMDHGH